MKIKRKKSEQLDLCRQNHCPACGSDQIEGEEITIHPGRAEQDVNCLDCDAAWVEYYTLESFTFFRGGK